MHSTRTHSDTKTILAPLLQPPGSEPPHARLLLPLPSALAVPRRTRHPSRRFLSPSTLSRKTISLTTMVTTNPKLVALSTLSSTTQAFHSLLLSLSVLCAVSLLLTTSTLIPTLTPTPTSTQTSSLTQTRSKPILPSLTQSLRTISLALAQPQTLSRKSSYLLVPLLSNLYY